MSYAGSRVCCDADSHIMETFDFVKEHADPGMREHIADLKLGGAGRLAEKAIANALERRKDPAKAAELRANIIGGAKGWGAYGAFDPAERREALDDLGFKCQLVFPTFAPTQFLGEKDAELKYGGARAANRAMGAFCEGDKRLMGVAVVPLDNPEFAAREIRNAAKFGCKAVWVAAAPAGDKSPGHPDLDIVWQTLVDTGLPFVLHIGQGTRTLRKEYENNGQERPTDWLGGGENLRIMDYMVMNFAPQMFLSALTFHGVFNRFPALKGGVIELGGGWVPDFLRRLDHGQKMFRKSDPGVGALTKPASEVLREHVKFTPFPGEDIGRMIRDAGDDLFLFSSDYPHIEGGKDPIKKFEDTMEGISETTKERFYRRNFEDMMGMA
ncbi:MAG TPA: amidohydrolase family protein [Rhizomicrobium sp.]|jgi:predicted TIM-barrel fold metal-dependent hydrolase